MSNLNLPHNTSENIPHEGRVERIRKWMRDQINLLFLGRKIDYEAIRQYQESQKAQSAPAQPEQSQETEQGETAETKEADEPTHKPKEIFKERLDQFKAKAKEKSEKVKEGAKKAAEKSREIYKEADQHWIPEASSWLSEVWTQFKASNLAAELKETYGKPLQTVIAVLGMPEANYDQIPEDFEVHDKGPKVMRVENYYLHFIDSVFNEIENPEESIMMQQGLLRFSLALRLLGQMLTHQQAKLKTYLEARGVHNLNEIPHADKMKAKDSPLQKAILSSLKEVGDADQIMWHILENKGEETFYKLFKKIYELYKGEKGPDYREGIHHAVHGLIHTFEHEVEHDPELKEFMNELVKQMLPKLKHRSRNSNDSKALEHEEISAIDDILVQKAPDLKDDLEKLYALKSLDASRSAKILLKPEGKMLAVQMGQDVESTIQDFARDFFDKANKLDGKVQHELQEIFVSHKIDYKDPNQLVTFFMTSALGQKWANKLGLSFGAFKNTLSVSMDVILKDALRGFPDGTKAGSFKKLAEQMVHSSSVSIMGGYEQVLLTANNILHQSKSEDIEVWKNLKALYPGKAASDNLAAAKGALAGLTKNPQYRDVIRLFDLLAAVMQNRIGYPTYKKQQDQAYGAVLEIKEAYSDKEGFNRYFTSGVPGVASDKIDFAHDKKNVFTFEEKLIELYAGGISDSRLVNMEQELKQILDLVTLELFENQKMHNALAKLYATDITIKVPEKPKDEKKEKKDDHGGHDAHGDHGHAPLSKEAEKLVKKLKHTVNTRIDAIEKKEADKEAREAARSAAAAHKPHKSDDHGHGGHDSHDTHGGGHGDDHGGHHDAHGGGHDAHGDGHH